MHNSVSGQPARQEQPSWAPCQTCPLAAGFPTDAYPTGSSMPLGRILSRAALGWRMWMQSEARSAAAARFAAHGPICLTVGEGSPSRLASRLGRDPLLCWQVGYSLRMPPSVSGWGSNLFPGWWAPSPGAYVSQARGVIHPNLVRGRALLGQRLAPLDPGSRTCSPRTVVEQATGTFPE